MAIFKIAVTFNTSISKIAVHLLISFCYLSWFDWMVYLEGSRASSPLYVCIHCIRKVYSPIDFFQILSHYNHILKLIKMFIPLINLYTIPHHYKAKTGFYKCVQMYKEYTTEISHLHKHYSRPGGLIGVTPFSIHSKHSGFKQITFKTEDHD